MGLERGFGVVSIRFLAPTKVSLLLTEKEGRGMEMDGCSLRGRSEERTTKILEIKK